MLCGIVTKKFPQKWKNHCLNLIKNPEYNFYFYVENISQIFYVRETYD